MLLRRLGALVAATLPGGCETPPPTPRLRLVWKGTGNPLRAEIDTDADAVFDRGEYFRTDGKLEKVGLSRRQDGRPDEWDYPDAAGALARREFDDDGDGAVDRAEDVLR